MMVLQQSCPHSDFKHLPFFLDPLHFPEDATPPEERDLDVLLYGNTW